MPSSLLNSDISFPRFTEEQSDSEKIEKITSYLFMLLEELRYSMNNLDKDNFNDTGFGDIVKIINDPVYVQLRNSDGKIAALQLTAEGLGTRLEGAEGNISSLTQTSESLTSRISTTEGNISTLQQTALSLTSRISNAEGSMSVLAQTVNGMTLSVTNGEYSSTIRLLANGVQLSSQDITFTGAVTFTDLSQSGATYINGDNIKTGTISAININGCTITGSTFQSVLSSLGGVGGEIRMSYIVDELVAGGIRLDDQGAGTSVERKHRMFLYTNKVAGIPFCLKLKSAGGMSISSDELLAIDAVQSISITAPDIYLRGNVFVNGVPYNQSTNERG